MTVAAVLVDDFLLAPMTTEPPTVLRNGLLPFMLAAGFCAGFYVVVRKPMGAGKNEAVQALFTLLMVSFLTLTLIGTWFRGAGMQLAW